MLVSILAKLKNRGFWAGIATAIAGVLTGAITAPQAVIDILTALIGG